jgi:hypothetical protein
MRMSYAGRATVKGCCGGRRDPKFWNEGRLWMPREKKTKTKTQKGRTKLSKTTD